MPYKDKTKQLDYQRKWINSRRREWVSSNGPCVCGSTDRLTMVAKRDAPGAQDAHIWSYKEGLRKGALKKFEVRCFRCAKDLLNQRMKLRNTGKKGTHAHLSPQDVWSIRGRLLSDESMRAIGRDFDITHKGVQLIRDGKIYSYLVKGKRRVANVNWKPSK